MSKLTEGLLEEKWQGAPQKRSKVLFYVLFFLLGTLTLVAFGYWTNRDTSAASSVYTDCGGSPEEARRRGCHFEILSFAWQTNECYDHENTEDFRLSRKGVYYADLEGTIPVDESVILQGETDAYVSTEYHIVHCTYMWRQMHRAFTVLGYIDSHLNNFNHTLHCQKYLLSEDPPQKIGAFGHVIYPTCSPVGPVRIPVKSTTDYLR